MLLVLGANWNNSGYSEVLIVTIAIISRHAPDPTCANVLIDVGEKIRGVNPLHEPSYISKFCKIQEGEQWLVSRTSNTAEF